MESATAIKSEQALNEANTAVFDPAMDIEVETTEETANFEYNLPVVCQKMMKTCNSMASASHVLLKNKKKIQSYVGPSKMYLVMKGMKLENSEVITIKFIGAIPRLDVREYINRRPNITTEITDSYGPICCTWTEFDGVRKNITSFVVCSGNGFLDICDFIQLSVV